MLSYFRMRDMSLYKTRNKEKQPICSNHDESKVRDFSKEYRSVEFLKDSCPCWGWKRCWWEESQHWGGSTRGGSSSVTKGSSTGSGSLGKAAAFPMGPPMEALKSTGSSILAQAGISAGTNYLHGKETPAGCSIIRDPASITAGGSGTGEPTSGTSGSSTGSNGTGDLACSNNDDSTGATGGFSRMVAGSRARIAGGP